ncbi:hypothetical protein DITRI_Ditri04bG0145200 [Diplodiscus trichospermus]
MEPSSVHLVAALLFTFQLFSHSFPKLRETNACNENRVAQSKNETTGDQGCHFTGPCSSAPDCRQPCAALGRNPDAVKCVVSSPGGNRCCCIEY